MQIKNWKAMLTSWTWSGIDYGISLLEKYSSKLNVWSWQKRWGDRDQGTGYRKNRK